MEAVIVIVIVAVTLALVLRGFLRNAGGKNAGTGCGGCSSCGERNECQPKRETEDTNSAPKA